MFILLLNSTLHLSSVAIVTLGAGDHFHDTGKETDIWIIKALSVITPGERGRNLLVIPELLPLQGHHLCEGTNPADPLA